MNQEGDIEAALSEAQHAVEQLAQVTGAAAPASSDAAPSPSADAAPLAALAVSPAMRRLMSLKVALRVRFAERRMSVGEILQLSSGAILEFDTPVQSELKLLINNKCLGTGEAVKVGENFGLRVRFVGDAATRIATLGGAA